MSGRPDSFPDLTIVRGFNSYVGFYRTETSQTLARTYPSCPPIGPEMSWVIFVQQGANLPYRPINSDNWGAVLHRGLTVNATTIVKIPTRPGSIKRPTISIFYETFPINTRADHHSPNRGRRTNKPPSKTQFKHLHTNDRKTTTTQNSYQNKCYVPTSYFVLLFLTLFCLDTARHLFASLTPV